MKKDPFIEDVEPSVSTFFLLAFLTNTFSVISSFFKTIGKKRWNYVYLPIFILLITPAIKELAYSLFYEHSNLRIVAGFVSCLLPLIVLIKMIRTKNVYFGKPFILILVLFIAVSLLYPIVNSSFLILIIGVTETITGILIGAYAFLVLLNLKKSATKYGDSEMLDDIKTQKETMSSFSVFWKIAAVITVYFLFYICFAIPNGIIEKNKESKTKELYQSVSKILYLDNSTNNLIEDNLLDSEYCENHEKTCAEFREQNEIKLYSKLSKEDVFEKELDNVLALIEKRINQQLITNSSKYKLEGIYASYIDESKVVEVLDYEYYGILQYEDAFKESRTIKNEFNQTVTVYDEASTIYNEGIIYRLNFSNGLSGYVLIKPEDFIITDNGSIGISNPVPIENIENVFRPTTKSNIRALKHFINLPHDLEGNGYIIFQEYSELF